MAKYASRVKDTTTDTGSGTITLSGTAPIGFQTFANAFTVDTDYFPYTLIDANGAWERGYGKLDTVGTELARSFVYESTNSNNAIVLSSGTHIIFCSPHPDIGMYCGYTVSLSATQNVNHNAVTRISWDQVVDDTHGFITGQLPLQQLTIPDWVDYVQVSVHIALGGMTQGNLNDTQIFRTKLMDHTIVDYDPPMTNVTHLDNGTTGPSQLTRFKVWTPRNANGDTFSVAVFQNHGVACYVSTVSYCQVRFIQ